MLISEPVDEQLNRCINLVVKPRSLLDFDRNTCISPFFFVFFFFFGGGGGCRAIDLWFYVHLLTPRDRIRLIVATNIDCHEPFTLVTTLPKECQSKYADYKMFTSCTFLLDTVLDYDLNACHFSCICHGHYDVILLRHNFLPWRNNNPEFYKTCDVHIAQQH